MLTAGGAGRTIPSAAMLGLVALIVTGCSSEPAETTAPRSSSSPSPASPAKIAVIPQKMPGEVARLEVDGDVVSNTSAARAKPGVPYAAYAACSSADSSEQFGYSVWLAGNRLIRTAVNCDGQQIINTAVPGDELGGRVRIKPHWTGPLDGNAAAGMSMTAYVVVAPEPGATAR